MIFVKYLVDGLPQTRFLEVVSLKHGKAGTIEQKLLKVGEACKNSLTNVSGFGSDGAVTPLEWLHC